VKSNSVFKDRLYTLPSSSRVSATETKIVKKILSFSKCDIKVDKLSLVCVEEDYDFYHIYSGSNIFDLKFSLDHESEKFNREIKNTKLCKSKSVPKYVDSGVVKVGDKISYLICESNSSESLFDYGRSHLSSSLDLFTDFYCDFASNSNYKLLYKTLLSDLMKEADMESVFDLDQKSYIQNNSDYHKCENIINELKSDISSRLNALPKIYTGNVIGDFDKNSVFTGGNYFSFKDLRYGCKGHVYSDIANITLYYGLSKPIEKALLQKIAQKMSLTVDDNLYNQFYQLELRRKALHYLLQYLKEVYIYESSRLEVIINLIDSFAQSFNRVCKIPIIRDNREFILRNIAEPIIESSDKD
jgi:hypothetical protein